MRDWFEAKHKYFLKYLDGLRGVYGSHKKYCTEITQHVYMQSVIKYPEQEVAGFLAYLIEHNIRVIDKWFDGEVHSLVRIMPRNLLTGMRMIKIDMSCNNKTMMVGWGAVYYETDGRVVDRRAGTLCFTSSADSPNTDMQIKKGLHPLHNNTCMWYEMQALTRAVKIAVEERQWRGVLIVTDNYLLQQVLNGVFTFPPDYYMDCIIAMQQLRQISFWVDHTYREANQAADVLARVGKVLMKSEYEKILEKGIEAFRKLDEELQSVLRIPPPRVPPSSRNLPQAPSRTGSSNMVIPGTINNHEVLARRIVDAGFHLTDEDLTSLNDVLARQKRGKTATARLRAERSEAVPSYYLQPRALFHKMCCVEQRPIKMQNSHFTLSSVGKRAFSSAVQGFQAAHGVKFGFKTMLCTPMDNQSQLGKATHAKELRTLNSSLCKKLPLFAAAIRRLLRA